MEIVPLKKEFCENASKLEKNYLSTAWSEKQLEEIVENTDYCYVTALENNVLLGVGGAICTAPDSAEIFTVAVDEKRRGKGVGGKIVSALIDFCRIKKAESIFLEVEEGNNSAIGLYKKFGFLSVGVRKGFYHGKNAIIMRKEL